MKITKYEHACIVIEEQGRKLVIDPGAFTPEFGSLDDIEAIVITHVHGDHFNPQHVKNVLEHNRDVQIFTVQGVTEHLQEAQLVQNGQRLETGPFTLEFRGEEHALIHDSLPNPHNTGVLVNDVFFYPGDSFIVPGKPVKVLAVPASGPWMSTGDAMDYITQVKPERCFPTHNALLSEIGHDVTNRFLKGICEQNNIQFEYVTSGQSIDT